MALLFTYLLPLLLPTVVYVLWRLWRAHMTAARSIDAGSGGSATHPGQDIDWRNAPWLALAFAGVILLGAVLLIGALSHRSGPPERYVPPRLENGRIVPGELRPEAPKTDGGGAQQESDGQSGTGGP